MNVFMMDVVDSMMGCIQFFDHGPLSEAPLIYVQPLGEKVIRDNFEFPMFQETNRLMLQVIESNYI